MEIVTFYAGLLVARTLAPVIKKGYELITNKEQKDELKKRNDRIAAFNERIELQNLTHQQRLEFANEEFRKRREEKDLDTFYKECWPIRNPFEIKLGNSLQPVSDDQSLLGDYIIPCRIISALKDNAHPLARTINGNLSSFILGNYSINTKHAAISDIGAWRDDAPANDASINYLYTGLRCQPTMVVMPTFIDDGSTIIYKMWAWGLGENLNYPAGFEFGRLYIKPLYYQSLRYETQEMINLSKEMGWAPSKLFSPQLQHNISILKIIEEKKLSEKYVDKLLNSLREAPEIVEKVKITLGMQISGMFCCIAGMYADSYHLVEYRTLPKLPKLLSKIPGVEFLLKPLEEYYRILLDDIDLIEPNKELVISMNLDVADAFVNISKINSHELTAPFLHKAQQLLVSNQQNFTKGTYNDMLDRVASFSDNNTNNNIKLIT